MFSRLVFQAVKNSPRAQLTAIRSVSSSTPKQSTDPKHERDIVNFPRRTFPNDPSPVRLGLFPEEWFTAFHNKTGVSGPYMLVGTTTLFLLSKEFWVIEHEFVVGLSMAVLGIIGYQSFGAGYTKWINQHMDDRDALLKAVKQSEIDRCKEMITEEETAQWMATSYETLIEAKRENVALQLETVYRSRLQDVYDQVKRRLDYQVETSNVVRRVEQQHMVNWIINSVRKTISAKQEDDALKKCITDLKAMV